MSKNCLLDHFKFPCSTLVPRLSPDTTYRDSLSISSSFSLSLSLWYSILTGNFFKHLQKFFVLFSFYHWIILWKYQHQSGSSSQLPETAVGISAEKAFKRNSMLTKINVWASLNNSKITSQNWPLDCQNQETKGGHWGTHGLLWSRNKKALPEWLAAGSAPPARLMLGPSLHLGQLWIQVLLEYTWSVETKLHPEFLLQSTPENAVFSISHLHITGKAARKWKRCW